MNKFGIDRKTIKKTIAGALFTLAVSTIPMMTYAQETAQVFVPFLSTDESSLPAGSDNESSFDVLENPFQLIVALENSGASVSLMASLFGATEVATIDGTGLSLWSFPSVADMDEVIAQLESDPAIRYAEPNYEVEIFMGQAQSVTPNDPRHSEQWALDVVRAYDAWAHSTGNNEVVIAIVDTGIDPSHPDLVGQLTPTDTWYDFGEGDSDPRDTHGHGTHCAGIAAAASDNEIGIAGLSWQTRILPVKVFPDGQGSTGSFEIARGIIHAVDQEADIINLSLGSSIPSGVIDDAIQYASYAGVVVVAAAGNSATNNPSYPAAFDNVISVAATDRVDKKASFSNFGSWVDISAPGQAILSTLPTYDVVMQPLNYGTANGTSMAAPYVAGLASLVLAQHPEWSPSQVELHLAQTARDINNKNPLYRNQLGAGRIDALAAVQPEATPTPVTPTPETPAPITPEPDETPIPGPTPPANMVMVIEQLASEQADIISGEIVEMNAVIKNVSSAPITLERLAILMRGPDCSEWGCTKNRDVLSDEALTLAPDETHTVSVHVSFGDAGQYFAQLAFLSDSVWYHFGERLDFTVDAGLRVVEQLQLTSSTPVVGDVMQMRAVLRNESNQALTLPKLAIIMRGPGCETWGCSSNYGDFGFIEDVTLAPQEEYVYTPEISFTESGPYFAQLAYTETSSHWFHFGEILRFDVNEGLSLVEPLALSVNSPVAGTFVQVTARLHNQGSEAIELPSLAIIARGPNCTEWWCEHNVDFGRIDNVVVPVGGEYIIDATFSPPFEGTYFAQLAYRHSDDRWYHFGNRIDFVAQEGLKVQQQLRIVNTEPKVGEPLQFTYTLHNASAEPLLLPRIAIISRGPNCQDFGCASGNDFGHMENIFIEPDEAKVITVETILTQSGDYFSQIAYSHNSSWWFHIGQILHYPIAE